MWTGQASWLWWTIEPGGWIAGALVLDAVAGDPASRWHPVRWIGYMIEALERGARAAAKSVRGLRMAGVVLAITTVALTYGATLVLVNLAARINPLLGDMLAAALIYLGLSARSLADAGLLVAKHLQQGTLPDARKAVGQMVSRETYQLTSGEVVRAAVESVAENTCDGVIAPLLFALVGGAPLLWAYKAVNTLDSMWGYRSPAYRDLGWFSARLDDGANYVPARISGLALVAAAAWNKRGFAAFRVLRRDGRAHPSPNGGQSEAAMAGALGIRLGGVNRYAGHLSERPPLGDAEYLKRPQHIRDAVMVMLRATALTGVVGVAAQCLLTGRWL